MDWQYYKEQSKSQRSPSQPQLETKKQHNLVQLLKYNIFRCQKQTPVQKIPRTQRNSQSIVNTTQLTLTMQETPRRQQTTVSNSSQRFRKKTPSQNKTLLTRGEKMFDTVQTTYHQTLRQAMNEAASRKKKMLRKNANQIILRNNPSQRDTLRNFVSQLRARSGSVKREYGLQTDDIMAMAPLQNEGTATLRESVLQHKHRQLVAQLPIQKTHPSYQVTRKGSMNADFTTRVDSAINLAVPENVSPQLLRALQKRQRNQGKQVFGVPLRLSADELLNYEVQTHLQQNQNDLRSAAKKKLYVNYSRISKQFSVTATRLMSGKQYYVPQNTLHNYHPIIEGTLQSKIERTQEFKVKNLQQTLDATPQNYTMQRRPPDNLKAKTLSQASLETLDKSIVMGEIQEAMAGMNRDLQSSAQGNNMLLSRKRAQYKLYSMKMKDLKELNSNLNGNHPQQQQQCQASIPTNTDEELFENTNFMRGQVRRPQTAVFDNVQGSFQPLTTIDRQRRKNQCSSTGRQNRKNKLVSGDFGSLDGWEMEEQMPSQLEEILMHNAMQNNQNIYF